MISRGYVSAALAAAACSVAAFAQFKLPAGAGAVASAHSLDHGSGADAAAQQPRILWIRNDMTGQVITPGTTQGKKAATTPAPYFIYNNYDNPNGVAGINLNWNYPEAYTNSEFISPPEGDRLRFFAFNLASDPDDPAVQDQLINGEMRSLLFEPYRADSWPVADLNERQKISEYTSVVASYSQQFEIRICRIYFFSLQDVTQPFHEVDNRYVLELQLSFAFVSFAFMGVESPFTFDLDGFDPPLKIKGDGLILTHWMKLSQPPLCVGDINQDGLVEDADFVLFLAQYNVLDCLDETMPDFCSADLNFDGFVDDADFILFLSGYNELLCPAPYVIRQAYAPIAGGRFRWDNDENLAFSGSRAIPVPGTDWPFPSTLVTVPILGSGPSYPDYPLLGCDYLGCQPSFLAFFSTLTGFHQVPELNMDADDLKVEYERFFNGIVTASGGLRPYWFYDAATVSGVSFENAQWVPSSTAKRFSITPPPTTAATTAVK